MIRRSLPLILLIGYGSFQIVLGQQSQPLFIGGSDSGYVDPALCAGCHRTISENYRRTGMARSFLRPGQGRQVEDYSEENTFYHEASDRYYRMERRNGRYYQRRHQIDEEDNEVNVVEKEVHFVLGSGNHGRTYLTKTDSGALFQLPVGWYAEGGGRWRMSPGYDRRNHFGFRRRVTHSCMFCHNANPEIEADSDASGKEPVFPGKIPLGIDCQRCHGPGRDHVGAFKNKRPIEEARAAILNPAKLNPQRQLDVCLQCHLESSTQPLPATMRRYDRNAFSYRPGEPLESYALHFDQSGDTDRFEVNHAGYRLFRSECFRQSNGLLTCTTCHDPHQPASDVEARRHYVKACRSCHDSALQELVAAGKHADSQACVACHMPRRRAEDAVHGVMTDHHIQRHKPPRDLLAPLHEVHDQQYRGEVVLYYPSPTAAVSPDIELYQAVAQVRQNSNLEVGIVRLEAGIQKYQPKRPEFYLELAEAYVRTGNLEKARPIYEEALRQGPRHVPVLQSFSWFQQLTPDSADPSESGPPARAIELLETASMLAPRNTSVLGNLGLAHYRGRRLREAKAAFRKALSIDPELPDVHNNLGLTLADQGKLRAAIREFREAIRVEPNFAQGHYNLGLNLIRQGEIEKAVGALNVAIRLDPNMATAHSVLGAAKARSGEFEEAIAAFRNAIRLDPNLAVARTNLALVLAGQGRLDEAISQIREAILLDPDNRQLREHLASFERTRQTRDQ